MGDIVQVRQGLNVSARARGGDYPVAVVKMANIQDDRLVMDNLDVVGVASLGMLQRHLLQPHDVLLTARWSPVKVALVPKGIPDLVADANLLVLHAPVNDFKHAPAAPTGAALLWDAGPYLWWYLTSSTGRRQLQGLLTHTVIATLAAGNLDGMEIPVPEPEDYDRLTELVLASEQAYAAAVAAAELRRTVVRDAVIAQIVRRARAAHPGTSA